MKQQLKLRVDSKLLSFVKRDRKDWEEYIESLLKKDISEKKFSKLINKLQSGYNLGGFDRKEVYDRD